MVERLVLPSLRASGCTRAAGGERERRPLGRFTTRVRAGERADARDAGDRVVFHSRAGSQTLACCCGGGCDQRTQPVSKFLPSDSVLRSRRRGKDAAARSEERRVGKEWGW